MLVVVGHGRWNTSPEKVRDLLARQHPSDWPRLKGQSTNGGPMSDLYWNDAAMGGITTAAAAGNQAAAAGSAVTPVVGGGASRSTPQS